MQRIFARPKVTYVVLAVAIVGFFALSAVGQHDNYTTDWTWVGNTGWILFMLSVLVTVIYTVALVLRTIRRRNVTA